LLDARWDRDLDLALPAQAARASALAAGMLDHRSLSAAARAGGRHREEALVAVDLPASAAAGAGDGRRPRLRAAAAAGRAGLEALQRDGALDALVDLVQRELERDLEVPSGLRARAGSAAEHLAEHSAPEDVPEVAEDVLDVREGRTGVLPAGIERARPEAVVLPALGGIGKDLVRLGGFLESRLGRA